MTDPTPAAPAHTPPPWLVHSLSVLTLVAVVALSLVLFRDDFEDVRPDDDEEAAAGTPVGDTFDRDDADTLVAPGHPWLEARGAWGVRDGAAALVAPAPRQQALAALAGEGPDGTVRVTAASVAPGWGVAFRVRDPEHRWGLVVQEDGRGWALEVVNGGVASTISDFLAVAPADGDDIEITLEGRTITATVGDVTNTLADDRVTDGVGVGVLAARVPGVDATTLRWDDLDARLIRPG